MKKQNEDLLVRRYGIMPLPGAPAGDALTVARNGVIAAAVDAMNAGRLRREEFQPYLDALIQAARAEGAAEERPTLDAGDPEMAPATSTTPKGYRRVFAYLSDKDVVIPGQPHETDNEETGHNCDFRGCGWGHVLARIPLRSPSSGTEAQP